MWLQRLVFLSLLSWLLSATAEVRPYEAEYDLHRSGFRVGTMQRSLDVAEGGSYVFESRMRTKGLAALFAGERIDETSRGRFADALFRPERYEYVRSGGKRDYTLQFDYGSGTVSRADERSDWSTAMPEHLLDKLAYQVQIMADLPTSEEALSYAIADKSKVKTYVMRRVGKERVETPYGSFEAVKLERSKPGSQRRTRVWCARELGWLPVKVEYRDKKGGTTVATLRALTQR